MKNSYTMQGPGPGAHLGCDDYTFKMLVKENKFSYGKSMQKRFRTYWYRNDKELPPAFPQAPGGHPTRPVATFKHIKNSMSHPWPSVNRRCELEQRDQFRRTTWGGGKNPLFPFAVLFRIKTQHVFCLHTRGLYQPITRWPMGPHAPRAGGQTHTLP